MSENKIKRVRSYGVVSSNNNPEVCFYCKEPIDVYSRTRDHLIPKSRGGNLSNRNKVWCCGECNRLKSQMTPEEFKEALYMAIRIVRNNSNSQINKLKRIIQSVDSLIDERKRKDIGKDQPVLPG